MSQCCQSYLNWKLSGDSNLSSDIWHTCCTWIGSDKVNLWGEDPLNASRQSRISHIGGFTVKNLIALAWKVTTAVTVRLQTMSSAHFNLCCDDTHSLTHGTGNFKRHGAKSLTTGKTTKWTYRKTAEDGGSLPRIRIFASKKEMHQWQLRKHEKSHLVIRKSTPLSQATGTCKHGGGKSH